MLIAAGIDRFDLYVGLTATVSALLGAGVGGWISGHYTLTGEEKRQQFAKRQTEDEQRFKSEQATIEAERREVAETNLARGVARAMSGDFAKARLNLEEAGQHKTVWLEYPYRVGSTEDRKFVASRLEKHQWDDVVSAEFVIESMVQSRSQMLELTMATGWGVETAKFVANGIKLLTNAIDSLEALAKS